MGVDRKEKQKRIIISPLEFRHFILDIPKINEKYQKQAVQFAIKSYYPGSDDNTAIDYSYKNTQVIGIAVNSSRLDILQKSYNDLISPTLLIANSFDDGIYICCFKEWIELQVIENGNLLSLHDFSSNETDLVINKLLNINNINNNEITMISDDFDLSGFRSILENKGFLYKADTFESILKKASKKKSIIYGRKQKSFKSTFYTIILILLVLVLGFGCFFSWRKSSFYKSELAQKKVEYAELKDFLKNNSIKLEKETDIQIKTVHSIHEILSEVLRDSKNMTITSFSYSKGMIRFEAENAKAIEVLETLKKSEIIYDVMLVQSLPKEDGNEKFIITGKIQ